MKLLRALQEKEVRPVGSAESVPVDLRIVAATHRDLERMIADGAFRTDLFYRLDVVRIEIPPLRERREDIPLLVSHFIAKHARRAHPIAGIEDDALELLCAHDWPGNVRELENVIESALALAPGAAPARGRSASDGLRSPRLAARREPPRPRGSPDADSALARPLRARGARARARGGRTAMRAPRRACSASAAARCIASSAATVCARALAG